MSCFQNDNTVEKMSTLVEACLYDWDVDRMLEWLEEVSLNLAGG